MWRFIIEPGCANRTFSIEGAICLVGLDRKLNVLSGQYLRVMQVSSFQFVGGIPQVSCNMAYPKGVGGLNVYSAIAKDSKFLSFPLSLSSLSPQALIETISQKCPLKFHLAVY